MRTARYQLMFKREGKERMDQRKRTKIWEADNEV